LSSEAFILRSSSVTRSALSGEGATEVLAVLTAPPSAHSILNEPAAGWSDTQDRSTVLGIARFAPSGFDHSEVITDAQRGQRHGDAT